MNLYLVTRQDLAGYDEYDSFVVCCETSEDARKTHPTGAIWETRTSWTNKEPDDPEQVADWFSHRHFGPGDHRIFREGVYSGWPLPNLVNVKLIGRAIDTLESGVVHASFNAG